VAFFNLDLAIKIHRLRKFTLHGVFGKGTLWSKFNITSVLAVILVPFPMAVAKSVHNVSVRLPDVAFCIHHIVRVEGVVAEMVWAISLMLTVLVSVSCAMFAMIVIVSAREQIWEIKIGISRFYLVRFVLMGVIGWTSAWPLIGMLFAYVLKLHHYKLNVMSTSASPSSITPTDPVLINRLMEQDAKRMEISLEFAALVYNLASLGASMGNLLVFILFGTTKTAQGIYVEWLRRVLKWLGIRESLILRPMDEKVR
ncbi:hypothetical protein HK102_011217, partial [Quaeritorhiza haematococci]